jgi:hypothetical protein
MQVAVFVCMPKPFLKNAEILNELTGTRQGVIICSNMT